MAEHPQDDKLLIGHEYDGIQELDNNLPRWWLYGFYFTIVFGIVYLFYYEFGDGPGMEQEYEMEMAAAEEMYGNMKPEAPKGNVAILTDAASLEAGKEIFNGTKGLCFTCHRTDGGGQVGPNLTDNYWIHGCSLETIIQNIITGFPDKGMVPYGSMQKMTDEELLQVASYVLSLQGTNPPDPKPVDEERAVECNPEE